MVRGQRFDTSDANFDTFSFRFKSWHFLHFRTSQLLVNCWLIADPQIEFLAWHPRFYRLLLLLASVDVEIRDKIRDEKRYFLWCEKRKIFEEETFCFEKTWIFTQKKAVLNLKFIHFFSIIWNKSTLFYEYSIR